MGPRRRQPKGQGPQAPFRACTCFIVRDARSLQGMAIPQEVLDKVSASNLEATFTKAEGAGLNPVQLFNSLINHPDLLAKLRDQRVMAAFMDITRNPAIVSKYESEPDILEVREGAARLPHPHPHPLLPSAAAAAAALCQHLAAFGSALSARSRPCVCMHACRWCSGCATSSAHSGQRPVLVPRRHRRPSSWWVGGYRQGSLHAAHTAPDHSLSTPRRCKAGPTPPLWVQRAHACMHGHRPRRVTAMAPHERGS